MARALERDGLVERRPDPGDARATRLYLTARAERLRPVAERVVAELEAGLSRRDRSEARRLLSRLLDL